MFNAYVNSLVTDFHAAQRVRGLHHERSIARMAEQNPEGLAALIRANPRMLNCLSDAEAIAKEMADAGYEELCDTIAHCPEVTREVRDAFRARGLVDFL